MNRNSLNIGVVKSASKSVGGNVMQQREIKQQNDQVRAYYSNLQLEFNLATKGKSYSMDFSAYIATRLLNELADKGAAEGKNPNMVKAGIKAQATRAINKNKL